MKTYVLPIVCLLLLSCKRTPPIPSINIVKLNEIEWGQKVNCLITYNNGHKLIKLPAKVKYRGGFSSKYYKHSFALEVGKKIKVGELPKDDDWILNASYIDKTFMRHKINFDLFNEMSPKNIAPKCNYINLSIDDDYQGLYILMQEVNAGMLHLDKQDTNAIIYKDPPIFYQYQSFLPIDTTNYYCQKFPKFSEINKSAEIIKFRNLLYSSNDSVFTEEIFKWVDINNIVDWHIVLLFSNNGDGIVKNFYLYKRTARSPFRFVIWDCDHTFGREGDCELNSGEKELEWRHCILLDRLFKIEKTGYKNLLKKRWQELRTSGILTIQNFLKHVEHNDSIIRNEIENNNEKWPENGKWYLDDNSYEQEIKLMTTFIYRRLPALDSYIDNL